MLTEAMATCMHDKGMEVGFDIKGGLSGLETDSSQSGLWRAAANTRGTATGYVNPQLPQSQIRQSYSQEVAERACLAELGFGSPESPSEQTYIDSYGTGDQFYAVHSAGADQVGQVGQGKMSEIVQKCPPPTWFLNVDGLVK